VNTPYRNDLDALRERKTSLEGEISKLRDQASGLDALRQRESELAKELEQVDGRLAAGGAKRTLPLLDQIRIASPCKADWNEMLGDERVRFCLGCEKNVYNLSSMQRDDAEALLRERLGNDLCVRFYQRADGTILTQDCPVGVTKKRRKKLALAVAGAGAMAAAAATMFLKTTCTQGDPAPVAVAGGLMYVDPAPTTPATAEPVPSATQAPVPMGRPRMGAIRAQPRPEAAPKTKPSMGLR